MKANRLMRASVFAVLLSFFLLPGAAHATSCTVVAGINFYSSINDALFAIGTGPGTIFVTGTCSESVQINNARSITIAGFGGASIVGPGSDAFDILLSQDINLENLDISTTGFGGGVNISDASEVHIIGCNIHDNQSVGVNADTGSTVFLRNTIIQNNTPNDGLDVFDNSKAQLNGSTVQNNGDPVAGTVGVFVARNSVVVFGGQTNLVQNNANVGIQARNLSNVIFGGAVTIQGHLTNGIILQEGSHLQATHPGTLIEANGSACPLDPTCGGVFATQNSTVDLGGTITNNQGSGVSAQQGANVQLSKVTVSNNTGDGVHIQWISIGSFLSGTGNTITGNGGKSVFCDTTSLAVGDLSGFSDISCAQIARPHGPPRPGKVL
jgi:parallel beta helix pectate lyase-like protein